MSAFTLTSIGGWVLVIASAFTVRGRLFATFVAVLIGIYTLAAAAIAPLVRPSPVWPVWLVLHGIVYLHLFLLARPTMRPLIYRILISLPASFFVAGTLFSLPWGVAGWLGFHPLFPLLPYALALIGLVQSLTARDEELHLYMDDQDVPQLGRHHPVEKPVERPLRIVQISDPHLGPFMSVERLRGICVRAVKSDPDLVLLTGDFLTMESQGTGEHLRRSLEPLAALPGRVFACHGNHDLEAPRIVAEALRANGIRLLIDEEVTVKTAWGEIDLLGFDFVFRERAAHISRVLAAHPRHSGRLRIALLHDPTAFRYLESGAADLVLSGHVHGGQLGLLSMGGLWTVARIADVPDHGLWAKGRNRMYVHRGTGHYGFPLRLGVPAEQGVIYIHVPQSVRSPEELSS